MPYDINEAARLAYDAYSASMAVVKVDRGEDNKLQVHKPEVHRPASSPTRTRVQEPEKPSEVDKQPQGISQWSNLPREEKKRWVDIATAAITHYMKHVIIVDDPQEPVAESV